ALDYDLQKDFPLGVPCEYRIMDQFSIHLIEIDLIRTTNLNKIIPNGKWQMATEVKTKESKEARNERNDVIKEANLLEECLARSGSFSKSSGELQQTMFVYTFKNITEKNEQSIVSRLKIHETLRNNLEISPWVMGFKPLVNQFVTNFEKN
ncbi:hypothetical protein ROZALSC1DRAFT_30875, partial [Rozella allomycis CSF55]